MAAAVSDPTAEFGVGDVVRIGTGRLEWTVVKKGEVLLVRTSNGSQRTIQTADATLTRRADPVAGGPEPGGTHAVLLNAELAEGPQVVVKDGDSLAVTPVEHLADTAGVARRLGVATWAILCWIREESGNDFPVPVLTIPGVGPVWDMVAVVDWYAGRRDCLPPEGRSGP